MYGFTGVFEFKPVELISFPEKTDIWVEAKMVSGETSAKVSVIYDINLTKSN